MNENADPDVRTDLLRATTKIFGDEDEGDDATAAAMIGRALDVPVLDGKLAFGTWQGVYLLEFEEGRGELAEASLDAVRLRRRKSDSAAKERRRAGTRASSGDGGRAESGRDAERRRDDVFVNVSSVVDD